MTHVVEHRVPESKRERFAQLRALVDKGEWLAAHRALIELVQPDDDFATQSKHVRLWDKIAPHLTELRPLRLALLGSSTTDHFSEVLRLWMGVEGFALDLWQSPYGTFRQTILDPASELYSFDPDVVWLFTHHRDVQFDVAPGTDPQTAAESVRAAVEGFETLWNALRSRLRAQVLQNNADRPAERQFGNLDGGAPWGKTTLLRSFNVALAAAAPAGVTIFDLDHIASTFGLRQWSEPRYWFHSKHAFALDANGRVAFQAARLIGSMRGGAKKCLVLDLDNTLWGGVIGDDGLEGIRIGDGADGEAFAAFQRYVIGLKDRGVILAVCSKNEMDNARLPFERHPDMPLRLDDIAVFTANWRNKADNITEIAAQLNIGLDAIVFVDDNPAERDLVRTLLPQVAVPELPEDPALYAQILDRHHYFETLGFSEEDKVRNQLYRENATRSAFERSFSDVSTYLRSLQMTAVTSPIDEHNLGRCVQLINKSNQFHLTGTRYSEAEIASLLADPSVVTRSFRLADRFGDNGLISVVILRVSGAVLAVDTWVMSCRVLSRGMEEFICREIEHVARERGCTTIEGRYVPSKKNGLVAGLFDRLGFKRVDTAPGGATTWVTGIGERPDTPLFIDAQHPAENAVRQENRA